MLFSLVVSQSSDIVIRQTRVDSPLIPSVDIPQSDPDALGTGNPKPSEILKFTYLLEY